MKKLFKCKSMSNDEFIMMGLIAYGANAWLGLLRMFLSRFIRLGLLERVCMTLVQLGLAMDITKKIFNWYCIIKKVWIMTRKDD